jgi:uncharacterized protein (TIGR02145 family)
MKRADFLTAVFFILIPVLFFSCTEEKVTPAVDFYVQSQGNLVGDNVQFTDNSKNTPTAWDWSFPGGTPSKSILKNPVVVYNTAGKYSVTLTATNADGSATLVKSEYVTIYQNNTFTDSRDSKTYKSLTLGNDEWMVENLRFIPTSGSYVYTNISNYENVFGRVYDWATAQTIAPQGWHLPSDSEFTALIKYLGGNTVAGSKMKSGGCALWESPNKGATNISGFNALPAGGRYSGNFTNIYTSAFFWTSTSSDAADAWSYALYYDETATSRNAEPKVQCMSVRCIKDK